MTGIKLDESELDPEEDREIKPYYIMSDFSEMFPKKVRQRPE